jgi:hypothetical protein
VSKRLVVLGLGAVLTLAIYEALGRHSPAIVAHVVEQTLLQKSPPGTDEAELRRRFRSLIDGLPPGSAQLEKLLALSQTLEKTQRLNSFELEQIIRKESGNPRTAGE